MLEIMMLLFLSKYAAKHPQCVTYVLVAMLMLLPVAAWLLYFYPFM